MPFTLNGDALWRLALFIAILAIAVLSALVFGVSSVTAILGFAGPLALLLNLLFGPVNFIDKEARWLKHAVRQIFQVTHYVKGLTLLAWAGVFWLSVSYAQATWQTYTLNPLRIKYVTLRGGAVDYLVAGHLASDWKSRLAIRPYIIPTKPFVKLKYLAEHYRVDASGAPFGAYIAAKASKSTVYDRIEGDQIESPILKERSTTPTTRTSAHGSMRDVSLLAKIARHRNATTSNGSNAQVQR